MEDLQRPVPPRSPEDRARAWVQWFGLPRLVGSAVAVVVVCAGAFWLVRTPPPPTEALLPMAGSSTSVVPQVAADAATDTDTDTAADTVTVHVAGAVAGPGVYELPLGARVDAAISAAGGALGRADPDALNLAQVVADGSRIYVPLVGEEIPLPVESPSVDGPVDTTAALVDVNRATPIELEALPGVGPATATAIVAERDRNGPFLGVDDLDRVPGIGPAKLEALRDLVTT